MSYHETRYAASFLTLLIVSAGYALRARDRWAAGDFDGPAGLSALGASVLWFIGTIVVAGILGQIIATILHAIINRGDVDTREDERDRLIEHRAMNVAFTTLGVAFVGAMIGLIMGQTAVHAIYTIVAGFILAGLVADVWRFALYRWGFRI